LAKNILSTFRLCVEGTVQAKDACGGGGRELHLVACSTNGTIGAKDISYGERACGFLGYEHTRPNFRGEREE